MNIFGIKNGVLVRKEWFGCLVCDTENGNFFQFNSDTFNILRSLKTPQTVTEILKNLDSDGFEISKDELLSFLHDMISSGIISTKGYSRDPTFFFEEKTNFREDCLVAPSSTTLYITEYCSKACLHCVTHASPKANQEDEYGVTEWEKILTKLHQFGVFSIVITGGEPLLKRDIFDILKIADDLGFTISLLTDLDDMQMWHIERISALKHLHDVQISLDGHDAETHDYIRGKGSFEKALCRMKTLHNARISYTVSTTVNNQNIKYLDEIADIVKKYGAKYLYLNPLAPYGRAKDRMKEYLLSDEDLWKLGQEYLRLILEKGIDPGNSFWTENLSQFGNNDFHPFRGCLTVVSIGVYNFSVGSRGECYLDSKMKAEDLLYLGNALSDDLEKMWYDPRLDKLRRHYSPELFTYIDQSNL